MRIVVNTLLYLIKLTFKLHFLIIKYNILIKAEIILLHAIQTEKLISEINNRHERPTNIIIYN